MAEPSSLPVRIPEHWPKVWALDIDKKCASVLWAAWVSESDVLYVYGELVLPRSEMPRLVQAIRKRGSWMPGLFDHLARGRSKDAADRIVEDLLDYKLDVFTVAADPDAGVAEVAARLATGRLKVFSTCTEWVAQYRAYRRDKSGELVSESDGLMRATDLLVLAGPQTAVHDTQLVEQAKEDWAAETRSAVTGY